MMKKQAMVLVLALASVNVCAAAAMPTFRQKAVNFSQRHWKKALAIAAALVAAGGLTYRGIQGWNQGVADDVATADHAPTLTNYGFYDPAGWAYSLRGAMNSDRLGLNPEYNRKDADSELYVMRPRAEVNKQIAAQQMLGRNFAKIRGYRNVADFAKARQKRDAFEHKSAMARFGYRLRHFGGPKDPGAFPVGTPRAAAAEPTEAETAAAA